MSDLLRFLLGWDVNSRISQLAQQHPETGLIVRLDLRQPPQAQRGGQQLLASVTSVLSVVPELQRERFYVTVEGETVTLCGPISTARNARLALRMAMETPGVKKVVDKLSVVENN